MFGLPVGRRACCVSSLPFRGAFSVAGVAGSRQVCCGFVPFPRSRFPASGSRHFSASGSRHFPASGSHHFRVTGSRRFCAVGSCCFLAAVSRRYRRLCAAGPYPSLLAVAGPQLPVFVSLFPPPGAVATGPSAG